MIRKSTSLPGALVLLSSIFGAGSKWYFVWLFARLGDGQAAVGQYGLLLAIATPIFVASQLGLRTIFTSLNVALPWATYSTLRMIGSSGGIFVFLLMAILGDRFSLRLAIALGLLKVADSTLDIHLARIQYSNHIVVLGLFGVSASLASVVGASAGAFAFNSIEIALALAALGTAVVSLVAWLYARRIYYHHDQTERRYRQVLRASLPVTTSQFLATLLFQIPVLILAAHTSDETVGVYVAAAYLLVAANLVGASLQTILITPYRRTRGDRGFGAVIGLARKQATVVLIVGLILSVPVVVVGDSVLEILYGMGFGIGRGPLALLCVASVANVVAYVLSVALNVANRYHTVAMAISISCLATVVGGVVTGASGADALYIGPVAAAAGAGVRVVTLYLMLKGECILRD